MTSVNLRRAVRCCASVEVLGGSRACPHGNHSLLVLQLLALLLLLGLSHAHYFTILEGRGSANGPLWCV